MAKMARAHNLAKAPGQHRLTGSPCFGLPVEAAGNAFTLVELMIGAAIIAFTMVALYGAF
jgi:prepilin-type N-terminal cleavage/methylation domain-containing protein